MPIAKTDKILRRPLQTAWKTAANRSGKHHNPDFNRCHPRKATLMLKGGDKQKMTKLKVDQPTFFFIETVFNGLAAFADVVTPNTPIAIASKVLGLVVGNAAIVLLGVESGDIPAPTAAPAP